MVTRIDLRIHAAAPSSRKDDDRAKAQAEAYAAFQPSTKTVLLQALEADPYNGAYASPRQGGENAEHGPDQGLQDAIEDPQHPDETTILEWDPTVFLDETQLGFTALESQLITSSPRVSKTSYRQSRITENEPNTRDHRLRSSYVPSSSLKRKAGSEAAELDRPSKQARSSQPFDHASDDPKAGPDPSAVRHAASSSNEHASMPDANPIHASSPDPPPSQSSYLVSPELGRPKDRARPSYDAYLRNKAQRVLLPTFQAMQENGRPAAAFVGDRSSEQLKLADAESSQQRSHSESADDITSELPTSYSLSDITSGSSRSKHNGSLQRSVSDPGPASHISEVPAVPARPACPDVDDAVVNVTPEELEQAERAKNTSPVLVKDFATPAPLQTAQVRSATPTEAATSGYSQDVLPTEIRPPMPDVSVQSFKTHVTTALDHLANSEALASAYKRVTATRHLRTSERGYWSFDVTPWTVELRRDFFDFLAKSIGEGKAGWGVWCSRGDQDGAPYVVKVFCWGEIVRHVYLLIYIASKSKVRKLDLRWIDAEGKVVVQVRSAADTV